MRALAIAMLVVLGACRPRPSPPIGPVGPVGPDGSAGAPTSPPSGDIVHAAAGSDAAASAADAVIESGAEGLPTELARAERAWTAGDDDAARVALARADALARSEAERRAVAARRVLVEARSGDPALALTLLDTVLDDRDLDPALWTIVEATAADRAGETTRAMTAWAAVVPNPDPATAAYARRRLAALRGVETEPSLGVLLPRTGRYAAFGDAQLAAAQAWLGTLPPDERVEVHWRDSGSNPTSAVAGARELAELGVQRIVGPLRPDAAAAVRVEVPVPLVPLGPDAGVGPALEDRLAALVRGAGCRDWVVFAPDQAYGRRAATWARAQLPALTGRAPKVVTYATDSTSFARDVASAASRLARGCALIADSGARAGRVAIQIQRAEWDEGGAPTLHSTAEGLGPAHYGALEGVTLAPAVVPEPDSEFARRFAERTGSAPDESAWTMARALDVAAGRAEPSTESRRVRIEGGRLVALP